MGNPGYCPGTAYDSKPDCHGGACAAGEEGYEGVFYKNKCLADAFRSGGRIHEGAGAGGKSDAPVFSRLIEL